MSSNTAPTPFTPPSSNLRWRHNGPGRYVDFPILSQPYRHALAAGNLRLAFDAAGFFIEHAGQRLPLDPATYAFLLEHAPSPADEALAPLLTRATTTRRASAKGSAEAHREAGAELHCRPSPLPDRPALGSIVGAFNGGDPRSLSLLHELIDLQAWRPVHWRLSASHILPPLLRHRPPRRPAVRARRSLGHRPRPRTRRRRHDRRPSRRPRRRHGRPCGYLARLRAAVTAAGRPNLFVVVGADPRERRAPPRLARRSHKTGYEFAAAAERAQLRPRRPRRDARGLRLRRWQPSLRQPFTTRSAICSTTPSAPTSVLLPSGSSPRRG